ncbi:unnamed protein product [Schistosoma mattheei]|uniref:Uncharacterized protein n=1 Tax=Schistosoma mattheei TaxID=31246 RepID=A0A183NQ20_9TREM|nr:unnamed protein product [Schistosoma mattheei]
MEMIPGSLDLLMFKKNHLYNLNKQIQGNEDVSDNKAIRKEHIVDMSHSENLHQISIRQKKPQKLKNDFKNGKQIP